MDDEPINTGRKPDGRFAAGNALGGRSRGSRNKTSLAVDALLQGEHAALTRVAIEKALAGDTVALRLCLDRIAPTRRDAPISFDLSPVRSAADILGASSDVLRAVSAGDMTPEEAARVMALLTTHLALIEATNLEARVAALEEQIDGQKGR